MEYNIISDMIAGRAYAGYNQLKFIVMYGFIMYGGCCLYGSIQNMKDYWYKK